MNQFGESLSELRPRKRLNRRARFGIVVGVIAFAVVGVSYGVGLGIVPSSPTPETFKEVDIEEQQPTRAIAENSVSSVRTCSVSAFAQDARLGDLSAYVLNAKTGETLYDRNGSRPGAPASGMKTLTSAAALQVLGPDYRMTTKVVEAEPGHIVLVGAGDVTLSRLPHGSESFYPNAPKIQDLAEQTIASLGDTSIEMISFDDSFFAGAIWHPTWDERQERIIEGSTSFMSALQLDGDRDNPSVAQSPRSANPVARTMQTFQNYLGTQLPTPFLKTSDQARVLAQVQSQPMSVLLDHAMNTSDNTVMESVARHVAIVSGTGNTFDALDAAYKRAFEAYGMDTSGLYVADGSGLSGSNAVSAQFLSQLFLRVQQGQGHLALIKPGLPISGVSGTLGSSYGRFFGESAKARGAVRAKTGWIDYAYTLSGIIDAQDGSVLTFAVYAHGVVDNSAKAAIDRLVAEFYECGDNVSNY